MKQNGIKWKLCGYRTCILLVGKALIEIRLHKFLLGFEFPFVSLTRNVSTTALVYLKGLLLCRRRNCQVMAEELQQSNSQRLHPFITASKWQYQHLMDAVTIMFWKMVESVGLVKNGCLIMDDWGNPKKGLLRECATTGV